MATALSNERETSRAAGTVRLPPHFAVELMQRAVVFVRMDVNQRVVAGYRSPLRYGSGITAATN